jgi:tRNA U34 5-methylaminomethyl-2-thiouridine-forming methyltransferase MnmC
MEQGHPWGNFNYQVIITDDGSPSLRSLDTPNQEIMHHSGGAWSETKYIYGNPLHHVFKTGIKSISVASVGLGLGYNELLVAKYFSQRKSSRELRLFSFEKDPFLVESLIQYFKKNISNNVLTQTYNSVLNFVSEGYSSAIILETLSQMYHNHSWSILGPLEQIHNELEAKAVKFNIILYDAFSSKTSPELWNEQFLTKFLQDYSADDCVLSTYACTGSLKRALRNNHFQVIERSGFKGKRNSLIGIKGFKSYPMESWTEIY